MEPQLQDAVRRRARFQCEYCRLPAELSELPFQIDHIYRAQARRTDEP